MPDIDTKVDNLEKRVNTMERNMAVFNNAIQNLNKVVEKLDGTLDDFQNMIIEIKLNSQSNRGRIEKLEAVSELNEKDKNINLAVLIKDNIGWIIILLIVLAINAGLISIK